MIRRCFALAVSLTLAMLALSCKKDVSFLPVEPVIESAVTAYDTCAVCTVVVDFPGEFSVDLEWSLTEDMESAKSHAMVQVNDSVYADTLKGLKTGTLYYYRATVRNSRVEHTSDVGQFATSPIVTTLKVDQVTYNGAVGWGKVKSEGGLEVTERGLCWGTSHNPTVSGNHASSGTGAGDFSVTMTGLAGDMTYVARAYAVNVNGIVYGDEVVFRTGQWNYTVTVSADPDISGTVSGGGNFYYGRTCTLKATPNAGYSFVNWTKDGIVVSTETSYSFVVTENAEYVAHFKPNSCNVTLNVEPPEGGTVSGAGIYDYGEECAVTATANSDYHFMGWLVDDVGHSANPYIFTVTGDCTLTAYFEPLTSAILYISVDADPPEGGTVTGGGYYDYGHVCTVRATANPGYYFVNWTENGQPVSDDMTYSFTVTGDRTLAANFMPIQNQTFYVDLNVSPPEGGTVTGGGRYSYGEECTVTATANPGYYFVNWTDGQIVSEEMSYSFTVTSACVLTANFMPIPVYNVNLNINPAEGGTVAGGGTFYYNEECTITATANPNYVFSNWTYGEGEYFAGTASVSLSVIGDYNLTANFIPDPNLSASDGKFSVSGDKQVYFSQGNLQYQASTQTWRFAENQYDCVWSNNSNISPDYDGWIDLFGWGTSGFNGKYPYMTSNDNSAYGDGDNDLAGTNYDWGVYNAISNGGNTPNMWRTLTKDEWEYVFNLRNTASDIRYAKARVNGVNGVILLPDDWNQVYGLNNTNDGSADFSSNVITVWQWAALEYFWGAIFLPITGYRLRISVWELGAGYYWSASSYYDYNDSYALKIIEPYVNPNEPVSRAQGLSVRLVRDAR